MIELMIRPGAGLKEAPAGAFYCEDWQCPARAQCVHHFGRAHAYWAMICWPEGKDRTPFFTPDRLPFAHQCARFELDKPRDWMRGSCEPPLTGGLQTFWCCTGCGAPECPRRGNVVSLFAAKGSA